MRQVPQVSAATAVASKVIAYVLFLSRASEVGVKVFKLFALTRIIEL